MNIFLLHGYLQFSDRFKSTQHFVSLFHKIHAENDHYLIICSTVLLLNYILEVLINRWSLSVLFRCYLFLLIPSCWSLSSWCPLPIHTVCCRWPSRSRQCLIRSRKLMWRYDSKPWKTSQLSIMWTSKLFSIKLRVSTDIAHLSNIYKQYWCCWSSVCYLACNC